jgi:hypothetical protein
VGPGRFSLDHLVRGLQERHLRELAMASK